MRTLDSIESVVGCVLVALLEGQVIGTCSVNICPNLSWFCRPYAIIENVVVSASFRGKPIGKLLMAAAKAHASEQGCYKVALMTGSKRVETHRFYEACGFAPTKTGFQIRFDS